MAQETNNIVVGKSPQGKFVAETPKTRINQGEIIDISSINWLGNPLQRYGKLSASRNIPVSTLIEMLYDPILAMVSGFTGAMLVKAKRVIECEDEKKRKFFEAMFRNFEEEFILQANTAVALGFCPLVKKFSFEIPDTSFSELKKKDIWGGSTTPFIVRGFDQVHPQCARPLFNDDGTQFDGINTPDGKIDTLYSLWITVNQARAFGGYRGSGRLLNCYYDWWLKHFSTDLYIVSLQKESNRIAVVSYPPGSNADGVTNQSIALAIGDRARSGASIAVPSSVYELVNAVTGEKSLSSVKKWAIDFLEASRPFEAFHKVSDHHDRQMALGSLLPPQAVLDVTGGDLGGPTSADKLTLLAEKILMLDAADIDRHINKYVFPIVSMMNFSPDSAPVRVRTVGIEEANRNDLYGLVNALIGDDEGKSIFDIGEAMRQLNFPTRDPKDAPQNEEAKEEAPSNNNNNNNNNNIRDGEEKGKGEEDKGKGVGDENKEAAAFSSNELDTEQKAILRKRTKEVLDGVPDVVEIDDSDIFEAVKSLVEEVPELKEAIPDMASYLNSGDNISVPIYGIDDIDLGGPGSGNYGHAGRPGHRGGSLPRNVAQSVRTGKDWKERQAAAKAKGKAQEEDDGKPKNADAMGWTAEETRDYLLNGFSKERQEIKRLDKIIEDGINNPNFSLEDSHKHWDAVKKRNELKDKLRDAYFEVLKVADPIAIQAKTRVKKSRKKKAILEGCDIFGSLVSSAAAEGTSFVQEFRASQSSRSAYHPGSGIVTLGKYADRFAMVHELGHWLEHTSSKIWMARKAFFDKRTQGEAPISLKILTGLNYGKYEVTKKDSFNDPYMGKIYSNKKASEIISMGIEWMARNPVEFAQKDPEYFDFIFNAVRGKAEVPSDFVEVDPNNLDDFFE